MKISVLKWSSPAKNFSAGISRFGLKKQKLISAFQLFSMSAFDFRSLASGVLSAFQILICAFVPWWFHR
jgi:hypothetical protein